MNLIPFLNISYLTFPFNLLYFVFLALKFSKTWVWLENLKKKNQHNINFV